MKKIKEYLKKNPILSALAVISFISLFFIFFQPTNKSNPKNQPTPTPIKFNFIRSIPSSGGVSNIIPTSAIEFQFSKPVEVSTLTLTMDPYEPFETQTNKNGTSVYIRPLPKWQQGKVYNFKLSIKSKEGEELDEPIDFNLKIEPLKDSPLIEKF